MIRIGTAGWNYRDWEGGVYPRGADQLEYMSRFFDLIEINTTFYGPLKTAEDWLRRTEHNQRFTFTAKLLRTFTHHPDQIKAAETEEWLSGMRLLRQEGKLAAVVVQYPWSFKNEDESRQRLISTAETFREFSLVIEFRHASWAKPEVEELLRDLNAGICNIDQPIFSKSIRPEALVTSQIGYLRCHGRNYKDWFRKEAGRNERYDYLYTGEELSEQADLVKAIAEKSAETYVVYNNHHLGKAPANALQLRRLLEGDIPDLPEPLAKAYPELWGPDR